MKLWAKYGFAVNSLLAAWFVHTITFTSILLKIKSIGYIRLLKVYYIILVSTNGFTTPRLKNIRCIFFYSRIFSPRAGWQQTFMHTTLCLHCCTPGDKGYRLTECCQSGFAQHQRLHQTREKDCPGGWDPGGEFGYGLEFPFGSYRQILRQYYKEKYFFNCTLVLHMKSLFCMISSVLLITNIAKEKDTV